MEQYPQQYPVYPPNMIPPQKPRSPFHTANKVVGGSGCAVMFFGFFFLVATIGITMVLCLPALAVCFAAVPLCWQLFRRTGRFRWLLQLVRAAGICLLAAIFLAPLVCVRFNRIPIMYPVKRLVYTKGVRNPEIGETILPYILPRKHDDYYFKTEPCMVAQDYTPFAYLFLHTDEATLRKYEERLTGNPHLTRLENEPYTEEEMQELEDQSQDPAKAQYQNCPRWIYSYLTENLGFDDDLTHAVVYQADNAGTWHGGSGAVINYETGLLVVWL